jgi:hypothetical protein
VARPTGAGGPCHPSRIAGYYEGATWRLRVSRLGGSESTGWAAAAAPDATRGGTAAGTGPACAVAQAGRGDGGSSCRYGFQPFPTAGPAGDRDSARAARPQ